jgi:putative sterol carrier protein
MIRYETREALEKVLTKLAELVQTDPAFVAASRGKTLTVSMEFPDLEAFFYTHFQDGQVEAGLGEPAESATVELVLDSDIFDRVFSGQLNPAKAAMKGDLAFSGNVAAAMRFQGVLSDFVRLYQQAKQQSGEAA